MKPSEQLSEEKRKKAETWSAISGYEGFYEVSDYGNVRSLNRKCSGRFPGIAFGRILKQSLGSGGYLTISLSKDNIRKTFLVHRLVAAEFCQKEDGKNDVNHRDFDKVNNSASNLEWCTRQQNVTHSALAGRYNSPLMNAETNKKRSPVFNTKLAQKLTPKAALSIRERRRQGMSYPAIGREFSISRETARQVCIGEIWKNAELAEAQPPEEMS